MIPVRLKLRNFMCYTDVHEPLEFDGVEVACLAGRNGHGKSALLDAITWALWGKARARSADELIHQSPSITEMEVEFEFRLGDGQYRVIRKRSRRGSGRSMLELAARDAANGQYHPLTGNSLSETESHIQQLLKMSYETFVNSSFILQGRADSFTTKTPSERKQILGEILDLSYYDRLEAVARQRAAERVEQQAVLKQQIQDDDEELRRQPELVEQQQRLEAELAAHEEGLKLAEARCETLRERLERLRLAERELHEQERRLEEARARANRQRRLVATAEAALEKARAVLEREPEIECGYADLQQHREQLDKLSVVQAEHGRLVFERTCAERIIAQERGRLEGRVKQLGQQLNGLADGVASLEQLERERAEARAEQTRLDQVDAQLGDLRRQLLSARERYADLKSRHKLTQEELDRLRQRSTMLAGSPECPVCQTALPPQRHQEMLRHYQDEEQQLVTCVGELSRDLREQLTLGTSLKTQVEQLEQELTKRSLVQERLARAERGLARAQEQARGQEVVQAEIQQLDTALINNDYALPERQEVVRLEHQVMLLGYDPETHRTLGQTVESLKPFEQLRQDLTDARRTVVREQQALDEAQRELAEWEGEASKADQRRSALLVESADRPTVEAEWSAAEADLRGKRLELGRLREELGATRQHLSTMEFTAKRRDERRLELQRVLNEREIYQELTRAFGKRGLQAMLIETAIPEIQDEANRLLGLLTEGRMQVSLETQRQARGSDNQIETLDIIIRDELGERAYELYSGGEAFRVNFAIRIALSKLLARRAGAKLQTLVIDEGFGSQDEQGRDRLIDAIRAVQPEFEKILVITHLSDIRDLFETRIEVTKTPRGSVIEVR